MMTIWTIGIEGATQVSFFDALKRSGITVLVDLRGNTKSVKPGFSENSLSRMCETMSIDYRLGTMLHVPEEIKKRSQGDFSCLKREYRVWLGCQLEEVRHLVELTQIRSLCLLGARRHAESCTRSILAQEIGAWGFGIVHLDGAGR